MDRKSIVAIALAIGVFVWANNQSRLAQKMNPPQSPAEATATATAQPAPTVQAAPVPVVEPKSTVAISEEKKTVATPFVEYAFTNLGGGISSLTLLKHQGGQPGEKMVLNAAATHPIGALSLKPDAPDSDGYTISTDCLLYTSPSPRD